MTDRQIGIASLAIGTVGTAASVASLVLSASGQWWAMAAVLACGVAIGAGLYAAMRYPTWHMVKGLRGIALGIVKEAYPDGISMAGRSTAEWEMVSRLVEAGILTTSEKGIVMSDTRYSLTVEAINAIRSHERRFRRLSEEVVR